MLITTRSVLSPQHSSLFQQGGQVKDPLFEPIKINQLELKNRICLPAMHMNMAKDFEVTDQLIDFYAERARGGVGVGQRQQQ